MRTKKFVDDKSKLNVLKKNCRNCHEQFGKTDKKAQKTYSK
jgi:hypothetical protein